MLTAVLGELGLRAACRIDFWVTLIFIILLTWMSRFIHYTGEWLFLKGQEVPITTFDTRILTVDIDYPNQITLG